MHLRIKTRYSGISFRSLKVPWDIFLGIAQPHIKYLWWVYYFIFAINITHYWSAAEAYHNFMCWMLYIYVPHRLRCQLYYYIKELVPDSGRVLWDNPCGSGLHGQVYPPGHTDAQVTAPPPAEPSALSLCGGRLFSNYYGKAHADLGPAWRWGI